MAKPDNVMVLNSVGFVIFNSLLATSTAYRCAHIVIKS